VHLLVVKTTFNGNKKEAQNAARHKPNISIIVI